MLQELRRQRIRSLGTEKVSGDSSRSYTLKRALRAQQNLEEKESGTVYNQGQWSEHWDLYARALSKGQKSVCGTRGWEGVWSQTFKDGRKDSDTIFPAVPTGFGVMNPETRDELAMVQEMDRRGEKPAGRHWKKQSCRRTQSPFHPQKQSFSP